MAAFWSCILNVAPAVLAVLVPASLGATCTRRSCSQRLARQLPSIPPDSESLWDTKIGNLTR